MKHFSRRLAHWLTTFWRFVGTPVFWRLALALFTLQAVYIALMGSFSMAFDEHFHLAAIKQYAQVVFPWSVTQPPGPAELSAFTADGSYLYHYLMSWPYRLLHLFIQSQTVIVVVFRLIDVGLVAVGFLLFRRVLLQMKVSRAAAQIIVALCMLMPMTPFLAGQLTYDSLFFTLSAATFLALVRLVRQLELERTVSLSLFAWALSGILYTSQVKYAFLPAAFGAALCITGLFLVRMWQKRITWPKVWRTWRREVWTGASLVALGVMLIGGVLFVQRYGLNYVRYGSLVPECQVVLGHERCLGFAPYGRDADIRSKGWYTSISPESKMQYPWTWVNKMVYESYFTVGPREGGYRTVAPLPVSYVVGYTLAFGGLLAIVLRLHYLLRAGPLVGLAGATIGAYTAVLYAVNYKAFLRTAVPLSIHGRYVLIILPLAAYLVYVALKPLYARSLAVRNVLRLSVALLLLGSLWSGGIADFIIRSDDSWYWPHAVEISRVVRSALWPFIPR